MTEPGNRQPAPGELYFVQAFINTESLEKRTDRLGTTDGLADWMVQEGLLSERPRVSEEEVSTAAQLKEALRALLRANNGEALDPAVPETLRCVARDCALVMSFTEDGAPYLEPADGGVRGAFAKILAVVERAAHEGSWARMKACREDLCQWAFYDRSKNRSGSWCAMSVCGTRSKMRTYRSDGRASGRKDKA